MTHGRFAALCSLGLAATLGVFALTTVDAKGAEGDDKPVVILDTTLGPITLELDRAKAPITVDNYLKYVDAGFYDNTIFHRVIPEFMIQGGGLTDNLREKATRDSIKNESRNGLSNQRGTIAMARKNDPNSATAQFYINLVDNANLDTFGGGYTVFGKVIAGMNAVDAIAQVPTENQGGMENVPRKPIYIKSAKRKAKP